MAHSQNDDAVLVPGTGYFLIGDVATSTQPLQADLDAFAADTSDLPTGWTNLGHTDLDDIFAPGQEDGETETKGSWQNSALREVTLSEAIDYYVAKSLQVIDNDILTLYYGGGDASVAGEFSLPDTTTPQERAACVVFVSGSDIVGFYTPKVSIRREDAIEFASDDFTKIPLRFTILQKSGAKRAKWIHPDLGA